MRIDKGHASAEDGACSSEQAEKEKWQTLNLQQLNDLQSKLMLVAGKASEGKEQVDQFVEVKPTFSTNHFHLRLLYLPDCLMITGLDWTYHTHHFIFSFTF